MTFGEESTEQEDSLSAAEPALEAEAGVQVEADYTFRFCDSCEGRRNAALVCAGLAAFSGSWFVDNGARTLEPSCGDGSEDEATNVRQIGNSAGLDASYGTGIYKLDEEPHADQQSSRNEGHAHKDENDQQGLNFIAGISNQERAHDRRNRPAGAKVGDG